MSSDAIQKRSSSKIVVILGVSTAILSTVTFLLLTFSFSVFLKCNASKRLLDKLSLARPGIKLADVKDKLGSPMRACQILEDVIDWGPVKDEQFCKDKYMYSFYAVTPNCRAIDVYTDANGIIIYATWHDL
jgi:hypothetical protein